MNRLVYLLVRPIPLLFELTLVKFFVVIEVGLTFISVVSTTQHWKFRIHVC